MTVEHENLDCSFWWFLFCDKQPKAEEETADAEISTQVGNRQMFFFFVVFFCYREMIYRIVQH